MSPIRPDGFTGSSNPLPSHWNIPDPNIRVGQPSQPVRLDPMAPGGPLDRIANALHRIADAIEKLQSPTHQETT